LKYQTGFDITVASELMAIFCLSNNVKELENRINNIIVAYSINNKPVYVKDFNITGAILKILKNALYPNAVQSLEGNLALIHGGPFANIAHGCNSLFATKTAMNIADYTVTEAGFGSDLGAEKFMDIVCDNGHITPNAVVLVASIRSLKMHGGADAKNLGVEDIKSLTLGLDNIKQHILNIQAFDIPLIIAINQFASDTKQELKTLSNFFAKEKVPYSLTTLFANGSKGALDLAKQVIKLSKLNSKLRPVYNMNEPLDVKINKIIKRCYGASKVEYSPLAKSKLKIYMNKKSYVCMAKTPLTFSDDPKEIIINKPITIHVKDIIIANGANFIIVMAGSIFRMPGLPKVPAACKM
jgi:formate--tetrahydrofolate ligase